MRILELPNDERSTYTNSFNLTRERFNSAGVTGGFTGYERNHL